MKETDEDIIIKYVMLSRMRGIGTVTQNALLDMFTSIKALFLFDEEKNTSLKYSLEKKIGKTRLNHFLRQRYDPDLEKSAIDIVSNAKASGIGVLVRENEAYPKRLWNISDMPVALYTKGKLTINSINNSVGIVGARRCSAHGKLDAIKIATEAADNGGVVISGMAKGIDSYAHTAVLKANGYTIAILGNGADICYPREHEGLYESIIKNGCIVTEYPPKAMPREYYFPRRNRLIAAFSDMLYVIDAGQRSGTKSTVEYAKKYEREVIQI